ncbi:hypothetical protein BPAE_0111g00240 [Botrytis paeoniae]|uniref:Uncharacterized protein n=1 Tax=Botrytis paeoniae TaxID=278948 RepID=A0A4Z1FMU4_9HELO|nr:hypothetical protein BPAE_0111g00240 [Botrytis paeoniae]
MTPNHNTRSQKGKRVDTGSINNKNNARSRKGKEVDTNTTPSEPAQDNEDATEKLQTQEDNLRQGVAAAVVKVFGIDRAESRLGDLSKIEGTADAYGTPLHAIVKRIQQGIDKCQSAIDKVKFMIVGNSSNDCEEEGEKDREDGYTSNGSAGSDIPAVPKRLQQPPHKQVDQPKASVVEPSAVADVAYSLIPRITAELSARRIDDNRPPGANAALDNAVTSSGASSLRRSKRIRDKAQKQE